MSQNIKEQFKNVVHGCAAPYHSKRADKFNDAIDTAWKIYANSSFDDMLDLAKNFGDFVREQYPEKNRAYLVDKDVIQTYMNSKAASWSQDTFFTNYSRLKKLEICCKHIYFRDSEKFNWHMDDVIVPKSVKEAAHKKDTPIPMEVSRVILADMREKRSEVVNAVTLSAYLGMRAEETTCLKPKSVHFTGGEFGLGWVQIVRGPEGGAKGGRPRVIPIIDKEGQNALKSVVAGKKLDDYIAVSERGGKMGPDNVEGAICDALKLKYGNTYLFNDGHGMRKTFAQRYYDIVRPGRKKSKAVSKTNEVLGHGSKRGPSGIKEYVKNMW